MLKGKITATPKLTASIAQHQGLKAAIVQSVVGGWGKSFPPYSGSYSVKPKIEAQQLPTKEKVMTENLTVEAISFVAVSNEAGGKTVIIGG